MLFARIFRTVDAFICRRIIPKTGGVSHGKHIKNSDMRYDRSASSRPHAHDLGQGLKTSFATRKMGQSELKLSPPALSSFACCQRNILG